MRVLERRIDGGGRLVGQLLVGVLVGAGLATMLAAEPVSVPVLGSAPGGVVGGAGVVVGSVLYTRLPDCGCRSDEGECDCSGACSR